MLNDDYVYVCCQLTPTILDNIIIQYADAPFKTIYFAIPPFNLHYYNKDKNRAMSAVKKWFDGYDVQYFFIDQPCWSAPVATKLSHITSKITHMQLETNEVVIDKVIDKTAFMYKYDLRYGTEISDKVYHNMWSNYRAEKESEWGVSNHAANVAQWSNEESYWIQHWIDRPIAPGVSIPPLAGKIPDNFAKILMDLIHRAETNQMTPSVWNENVEAVFTNHGLDYSDLFQCVGVQKKTIDQNGDEKSFIDSQILDTFGFSQVEKRKISNLSWSQNGRYFEWISKFLGEAYTIPGAKSDIANFICIMLHMSGLIELEVDSSNCILPMEQNVLYKHVSDFVTTSSVIYTRYKYDATVDNFIQPYNLPMKVYHDMEFDDTATISLIHMLNIYRKNCDFYAQYPSDVALDTVVEQNRCKEMDILCFYDKLAKKQKMLSHYGTVIEDDHCVNLAKVMKNPMLCVM